MTGAARTAGSARRSTSSRSTRPGPEDRRLLYPDAARGLLRDTILAAVDHLVRSRGWSATTMSDIAAAAGVSRQTVYNEFGSRRNLVEQYVRGEIEALVIEVEAEVRAGAADPQAALRTAFELFLRLASDGPVVQIIVADAEGGELMRLLTALGRSVATTRIAALIVQVWPRISPVDAAVLAESLVRLAISHALLPTDEPERTAEDVTRMLGPFMLQVLGD